MRCRFCGSQSIQPDTEHRNFSIGAAVAGAVLVGPVGAVGGFTGKEKKGYRCAECGAFMETPMDFSTKMSIDSAVCQAETLGKTDLLHYFQKQYPNVRANVKAVSETSSVLSTDTIRSTPDSYHTRSAVEGADLKQFHRNQTWQRDSPVFVEDITIQTLDGQDVLSMTIWNQSEKSLRSAYFNAVVYDDTGDELQRLSCTYQKLSVAPGKQLPQGITFPLKTDLAYRVDVVCDKVSFTDDSVWRNDNTPPIMLAIQTELTPEDFPRLKYVRQSLKNVSTCDPDGTLYLPSQADGHWRCICGHPVEEGKTCPRCGASQDKLGKLLSQEHLQKIQKKRIKEIAAKRAKATMAMYENAINAELEERYENALDLQGKNTEESLTEAIALFEQLQDYEDAKEQISICKRSIEQIKEKAEADHLKVELARKQAERIAQRNKKIAKIMIPIVFAVVGLIILFNALFNAVIIPNRTYKNAVALMEAEQYEEASSIFETLDDYKDSSKKLVTCKNILREQHLEFLALRREETKNSLSAGYYHTVGLKANGRVVAVGYNEDDQCNVGSWTDIVAIAAGGGHTVGLKGDGTVVAVGYNKYNQCDVGNWTDIVAIATGSHHTVGLKTDGTVVAVGYSEDDRCNVGSWTDIVAITAGGGHTVGLKADGTMVAVGYNEDDRCDVDNWTNIVAIVAGDHHTVGLEADGTVATVGNNNYGQCNVDRWTDIVAIVAGGGHTVGLKADGMVVAVGYNEDGQCNVDRWTDIVAIAAGGYHTVGLKADGTVVAVGSNNYSRCDVGSWKLY